MTTTRIAICAISLLSLRGLEAQAPEFEVATVKANNTGSGGASFPRLTNGTLSARNVSLSMLIQAAYDTTGPRIKGPDWIDADRFDLAGKAPRGIAESDLMPMLQALLKDRFHLVVHREMKESPVYEMIIAKSGLKMLPYDPARPLVSPPNRGGAMIIGSGTMPQLAIMMTGSAGRPVLDKTGLQGRYTYILTFLSSTAQLADATTATDLPDFFTAVQEQLGLKLEPKNGLLSKKCN